MFVWAASALLSALSDPFYPHFLSLPSVFAKPPSFNQILAHTGLLCQRGALQHNLIAITYQTNEAT